MKRIKSFEVDHTTLVKGLYVSRTDRFGETYVTTFDLRMKTPYKDEPLKPATAHTLEHCLATYLRNVRDDVVYVGPMGCMTGFYVVLVGRKGTDDVIGSLRDAFGWTARTDTVPGATERECGNCAFMNLPDARREADEYLVVLERI